MDEFQTFYGEGQFPKVIPIVAMSSLTQLKENGRFVDKWMGIFHDAKFTNFKTILTFDEQGNMRWSMPEPYFVQLLGAAICHQYVRGGDHPLRWRARR